MAALVTARFCGGEVIVSSLTTETTQVWARPDGRLRADLAAGPVRMRDGRGGWVPVDLTLQRRPDGSVAPRAHPSGLMLSGAAGAGEHDVAVLGVGAEQVRLGWGGPLPEPSLSGAKAVYSEVRPGVDLVVEVTRTGFEQFLVVKTRAALAQVVRLVMPWRHGSMTARSAGGGLGLWTADGGRQVWTMAAPVMWDARTDPETGDPTHVAAVEVASVARAAGGSELVLTPAAAFLTDPAVQFPVTIDPSITATAVFDTYVQNTSSTSAHTSTELRTGTTVAGTTTTRSFLRFDMSPVYGQRIGSAQLNMWLLSSNSCNVATWELWRTGWADYATIWSNQPSWLAHYHTTSQGCGSGWTNIPATGWVQWAADNQYAYLTMGLKGTLESSGQVSSWKRFNSIEAGSGVPYLSITFDTPPTVAGQATVPATQCVMGTGRPFINSVTPQLRVQALDVEASPVSTEFEWWVTNGAKIGGTTVGPAASGSWLAAVVPGGAFSNGGTYSWRARSSDGFAWGAWSAWCEFTVDTVEPNAAPGVSSTTYPERPPTPDGYIYSVESRAFEGGSSVVSGLTGDDAVTTVSLPFGFTLYGQQYTSAWLDTNGRLSFVDPGGSHGDTPPALPNAAAPNAAVYGYGEDLIIDGSASVRTATYGSAPERRFVVEWNNAQRFANTAERITAAITLYETGEVATNYTGINPASDGERGNNATVGVENATGTKAEQYSRQRPVLADNTAVVFRPGVLPPTSYTKTTGSLTYAGGATVTGVAGDDEIGTITLPFPVNFYGRVYTSVYADTNGALYFEHPLTSHNTCAQIPNSAEPNAAVYVFCDDLWVDSSASIRTATLGTAPNRQFVIEWYNTARFANMAERFNAAITLSENGTISLNYSSLDNGNEQGANALTGIEDRPGGAAIQHSWHQAVLANNTAVTFTPVAGVTSTGGAGITGTFTFTPSGVGDVASYQYGLNANPPTTVVNAAALGGNGTTPVTPTADGPQVLYVRSQDRAGNQSDIYPYHFFAGPGGLTSPKPGDITAAFVALTAAGHPASTGVTYQWRRADTDTWTDIPLTFVSHAVGGGPVGTWPITTIGSGTYPKLNWNVEATLAAADAQSIPRDGPLQVRALFSGLTNGTANPVKITFDRNQASAAATTVGPCSVNLLTGNCTLSDTDVSVDSYGTDLTVTRAFNTRRPAETDTAKMYGPGWVSGAVVADANAPYTNLKVFGSLVQVGLPDGETQGFTQRTATEFDPEFGSEFLKLSYASGPDTYTLTDDDGNTVAFTRISGAPTGLYNPTAVTVPGSGQTTTLSWEKVTISGADVVRPTRMLAPVPDGVACTTLVRGCRALTFTYAMATTATGTGEAQWGDYLGRVKEIAFTAWDPDLTTPAMRTVAVARYSYDSDGRLRATWDPRLDYLDGAATKHLWKRYAYDSGGVPTTVTPAGQEPWQLGYTTIPGDAGAGRLATATRSALSAGTATTTLVYKVPLSGSGAPYDLSAGQTARWGQGEAPVSATAVFPATQLPTGNQAAGTLPSSWERASVSYLDANGRTVNTAAPGGYLTSTGYDPWGNTIRTLTAANRARALDASPTDTSAAEAALAGPVASVDIYSTDGQLLLETFGPEHTATLPDGTTVRGRTHTVTAYDQGAPGSGGPFRLPTTKTITLQYTNAGGTTVDTDSRTTTTEYNWTLRQPTASIVDPTALALKTRTGYDAITGLVTATTAPAGGAVDTTPSTRKTIYYRATSGSGYTECDLRPEWANLPCRAQPGGQPGSGPELPITVTTYDLYNQTRTVVEKNSSITLRTTTTTYDGAGRVYEVAVTAAAGLGTAVPTRRSVYEPATGQVLRTQSMSGGAVAAEIVRVYDTLGRLTSYTDGDANTATTTYDILGRTATHNDGKATRTYTYDGGTERRGLATSLADSQAGTFTGSYNADGTLVTETWPTGMVVTTTIDETGSPVGLRYDKPGCGQPDCTIYNETVTESGHAQWRRHTSTLSEQTYDHDKASRLTTITDTVNAQCTTRTYTFSIATNRTGITSYGPASGSGACQTSTAAGSQTWTYDTADRLTTSGTIYDNLGRTTTVPAADTANPSGGNVAVTYHHTDLVDTITQGTRTTDYTLDISGERIRTWTDNLDGTTTQRTHHYTADTDNPAWTQENTTDWTRTITGLGGVCGILNSGTGAVTWQFGNIHGDLTASVETGETGLTATFEATEYGLPRNPGETGTRRYTWLGAKQRAADTPTGITLMGVRVYNPATARFIQVDPIYGGSANNYEYCYANPASCFDLDGRRGWCPFHLFFCFSSQPSAKSTQRHVHNSCLRGILMTTAAGTAGMLKRRYQRGMAFVLGRLPYIALFSCGYGMVQYHDSTKIQYRHYRRSAF